MTKHYTEEEIKRAFIEDVEPFPYKRSAQNNSGKCQDTKRPFVDVLAEYILNAKTCLYDAGMLTKVPYKKPHTLKEFFHNRHDQKAAEESINKAKKQNEKMLVRNWVKDHKEINGLGMCFEYELNLVANAKTNIDLLTYDNACLHIVEVKGSKEGCGSEKDTLLHAALEIETYWLMLSCHLENFKANVSDSAMAEWASINKDNLLKAQIKKAVLIPIDGAAYKEWLQINSAEFSNLKKLISKYEIEVITYDKQDN